MNTPPRKRKKATSTSSDLQPTVNPQNSSPQDNQDLVTIDVPAVEVPELTPEEQSDKPDGMATLTACTWSEKSRGHFLRQVRHWQNCAIADFTVQRTAHLRSIAAIDLGIVAASLIF
ncbi:hypothetical protein [Tolypothrix sp. FACHB-123]|uniref:hypothetical protein n=1 Tax=Tolypothrix sp. FACHB-123 TaxID=2692868 RepID=UPI0027D27E3E|nr:hypothetical protein [Tolypothrix sp. FACHB-123]